jgi:hypothetical protein
MDYRKENEDVLPHDPSYPDTFVAGTGERSPIEFAKAETLQEGPDPAMRIPDKFKVSHK